MFYVYVLKSRKWNKPYVGFTNNLKRRVKQHNDKRNTSTKYGIPWKLVYYEAFLSRKDAIKRERQLKKHGSAIGFLKKRIDNSMNRA
jgi:putative endonuclease